MAKANIETKSGTKITIEGTPDEVSSIISVVEGKSKAVPKKATSKRTIKERSSKPSIPDFILELKKEGFFDKPKTLKDIKNALDEKAYFYPQSTLSGVVLGLIRKRELGRIKKEKIWTYVRR